MTVVSIFRCTKSLGDSTELLRAEKIIAALLLFIVAKLLDLKTKDKICHIGSSERLQRLRQGLNVWLFVKYTDVFTALEILL